MKYLQHCFHVIQTRTEMIKELIVRIAIVRLIKLHTLRDICLKLWELNGNPMIGNDTKYKPFLLNWLIINSHTTKNETN